MTIKTFSYRNWQETAPAVGVEIHITGLDNALVVPTRSSAFSTAIVDRDAETIIFTNGTLAAGKTDTFGIMFPPWNKGDYPITEFTLLVGNEIDGTGLLSITPEDDPKEFKRSVCGFTQDEYYDFSDASNGILHIGDGSPGLNIQYTLTNLRVYANLPGANFDPGDYLSIGGAMPVFTQSSYTITPDGANDLNLSLGPLAAGQYELAAVDSLAITDLDTGDFLVTGPMYFAENTVQPTGVPLPRWMPWGIMLGIVLIAWRVRPDRLSGGLRNGI